MAETSKPQSPTSSTEMHWGVVYLRQDIQDLRQDMRHQIGILHGRIEETNRSLGEHIEETNRFLGERIDATNRRIDSRFALLMTAMIAMTGVLLAAIKL